MRAMGNSPEGREGEPQKEHKLEDVVEGEPVDNADQALENGEESKHNPVLVGAVSTGQ